MKDIMTTKHSTNSQSSSEKTRKAFFFLRHNNDIDHITPVLYKWLSTEDIPTDIIITTNRGFLNDYRIEYLKKFQNVRIFYINDLFNKTSLAYIFSSIYFKYTTESDNAIKIYSTFKKIANRTIRKFANQLFKEIDEGIVVFDWVSTYFVQQIVKIAKKRGFSTISLPHGDAPYANFLISNKDLNYKCLDNYGSLKIFDYVVVPNILCFKRYEPYMSKNRIKIFGSPRYSDEWMKIISGYTPPFDVSESKNKLKIVFFLRNTGFPIQWEEVVRTIKIILQFPNVYLIVKHHPRNRAAKKLTKELLNLYPDVKQKLNKNLTFIYEAVNSSSLMNWADLIIDIGTSVTWEAIKLKKPVLMLEHLHSNISTVAYYVKGTEINCRDDLYNILEKFIENKIQKFYNEKERNRFIKEVIDVPDKFVLERYVHFLKSFFIEKPSKDEKSKKSNRI